MLRSWRTSHFLIVVALVALACLGGALCEESFVHTDDGCSVEIHCVACRLIAGTSAVVSPAVALPFAVLTAARLAPHVEHGLAEVAFGESPSRAPPFA